MDDAAVDVRPEARPRERSPVSDTALWASVLGGPLAFLVNLEVAYVMVDWACNTDYGWVLHAVHLVSFLLASGAALLGLVLWRRLDGTWPDTGGGSFSRSRLLAAVGTLGGALFAVSVLAQWLPVMVLGACARA